MIDRELLKKALAVALEKGGDFADIFAEQSEYNWVIADDKKLKTDRSAESGLGIRVVRNHNTFYAITDSFSEDKILTLAAYVRDAAGGNSNRDIKLDLREESNQWPFAFMIPPRDADIARKVACVKEAEDQAWTAPNIKQVTTRFADQQRQIMLATTLDDKVINHTLGLTEFSVMVIIDRNGQRENGRFGRSFYGGMENLTGEFAPDNFAREAVRKAELALTARDCPRGTMPVVFAPGVNGILFHESCGHGMEADLIEKGSVFGGKIGQAVASEIVTLVDDGTLPGYGGSFEFDDEGTPSQKTVLIENGILRGYMHSAVTAQKMGVAPTGSGRRQSYKYPPIPRMRNTYILGGETDPQDIIKDTKRGLYAVDTGGGGQVNVITGEFITGIKIGYVIEDGKLAYPVKGAAIIGRGIDTLGAIDMIGNDLEITKMSGRCGKGSQQVPVGVGMPTVRVKSLNVGGTGEAI